MKGILLDPETGDLLLQNKRMVIGEVTGQNQFFLFKANKGEIKEDPLCGIGIDSMLLEHNFAAIRKEIINQMERDGQRINKCVVNENGVFLDAEYR